MSVERNQAIVGAFVGAIDERDLDSLGGLVAEDFVRHGNSAPAVNNRGELEQFLRREFESFPDGRETVEDIVAEGSSPAVE